MIALPTLLLWTLSGFAAVWDLRFRRIPNALIVTGLLVGALTRVQSAGPQGLMAGLAGALAALLIYLIPFAMRKVGGGDVKLAMVCGMFLGARDTLWLILYATAINGLLAIGLLIGRRALYGATGPAPERWAQVPKAVAFAAAVLIITLAPPG